MINNDDEITYVDLCRMNEHYFINIASVGIDAEIAKCNELYANSTLEQERRDLAKKISELVRAKSSLKK